MIATPCGANGLATSDRFAVRGKIIEPGDNVSVGGVFSITGDSVRATNGIGSGEFALSSTALKQDRATEWYCRWAVEIPNANLFETKVLCARVP